MTPLSWVWLAAMAANAAAVWRGWRGLFWFHWWALANLVCSAVEVAGRNPRMPLASIYYPFWIATTPILGLLALCATAEAIPFSRWRCGVSAGLSAAVFGILHLRIRQPQFWTEAVTAYVCLLLGFCGLMAVTVKWPTRHTRTLAAYCLASVAVLYAASEFKGDINVAQQAVELIAFAAWATTGPRR